ncbi:hypothetical protein GDO86_006000 [Hymenochirus boettgeri]|uniref:Inter-alpha-trypsin inhibitor heavy chain 2 n=1 Tax=Hymenochirus boettgeri TaxID=247094 RepID=A0A8T2J495_9PIPI|nr:hypothetical protein GDO86_006000 [Hymenochirus boettgeri]
MKLLICLVLLSFTAEIRGFDILIEESPDSADLGELLEAFEPSLSERYKRSEDDGNKDFPEDTITLQSYKVESTITSHFVNTMIQSKVVNNAQQAQNLEFDVQIPKGAFINNFTMNVNGITFSGSIKEKTVARNLYSKARARGKAAGLMRTNSLDMENFKAELNVPPGTKVQFEIHYQEALRRKLGVYEHTLYVQPGRLAKNLEVDIYITEPQGFSFVNVPKTIKQEFAELVKISKGDKKAHISFRPTVEEQRQCPTCSTTAVNGNLLVKYDVQREKSSHLQVFNGYFLHFFAPENLPPLPKNILFVIDVSGSMWGIKMKQTVEAMKSILDDLRPDDQFSLVDFNHNIRCWKDELVYASPLEKEDAKTYVQRIQPNGGTNINEALLRAIFILKEASNKGMLEPNSVSLIVLVSDGDPTVGELKLSKIQKNVRTNIQDEFALHSLGIGFDVDYDFLERLSQENHGMAQRIYGNQDTAAQLKVFIKWLYTVEYNLTVLQIYFNGNLNVATSNFFPFPFLLTALVVNSRVPIDLPASNEQPTKGPEQLKQSTDIYIPQGQKLVDDDPHFIINLPISQTDVCFNIDCEAGTILNLVSDPEQGITVNGEIVAAKKPKNGKLDTYFGTIGLFFQKQNLRIEIGTEKITIKDEFYNRIMSWSETSHLAQNGFVVSVKKNTNVTIKVKENMKFLIILHRAWKKHPVNVDFLGLYIPNENKFSASTHGLIGQFRNEPEVSVYDVRPGPDPEKPIATMLINENKLTVTRGMQKNYDTNPGMPTQVQCWFVHNNGKGFIDGHYRDYIVPQLYSIFKQQ